MDNRKIGNFISERRKVLGLTQQQLADQLAISNKAISKWETGEGYPDICIIPELCTALGISADDFFAGEVKDGSYKNDYVVVGSGNPLINSNHFIKFYEDIAVKAKEITKKNIALSSYLFFLVIMYYMIPSVIYSVTNDTPMIWLFFFLPVICTIYGAIYGINHKFSFLFTMRAGIVFLPTYFTYMGEDTRITVLLAVVYMVTTFLGSGIAAYCKNRFTGSIVKQEPMQINRLQ